MSLIVPFVFFILSFVTLIIITRSVKVGDDSVLRCQLFKIPSKESDKTKPNDQSKIDEIENDALDEGMDESPKITMVEKLLDSNGGTIAL